MIEDGKSFESLLESDRKEQIRHSSIAERLNVLLGNEMMILANPLFLHFCLWFLYSKQDIFVLKDKKAAQSNFCLEVSKRIDSPQLDLAAIADAYFGLHMSDHFKSNDEGAMCFWKDVFSKFQQTQQLLLGSEDPVSLVIQSLQHLVKQISLIQLVGYRYNKIGFVFDFQPLTQPCPDDIDICDSFKGKWHAKRMLSLCIRVGKTCCFALGCYWNGK